MFDCVAPCLLKTQQIFQPGGGHCTWCIDGSDMIVLLGVQWCSLLFIFTVCNMCLSFVPTYHIVALAIKMRLQTQNLACKFRKGSVGGWASHSACLLLDTLGWQGTPTFARLAVLDFYAHVLLEHSPQVCLMKTMSKCILDTDMFWWKSADKLPKTLQLPRSLIFTTENFAWNILQKKICPIFWRAHVQDLNLLWVRRDVSECLRYSDKVVRTVGGRCQQMSASRL